MCDVLENLSVQNKKFRKFHPIMTSPLAGVTDLAYRETMRDFGDGFYFVEMISTHSLLNHVAQKKNPPHERFLPGEPVQLFGDSPVLMAKGAKILEDRGASHININMGCPVKKVWKACAGAQLMSDLPRATEMMRAIRKAVKVPVSVKTRIGINDSEITAFKMRDIATEEGMEFFCVHGRTRTQMYTGKADWSLIENLAKESKIPVIGNGDIFDEETAIKRLEIPNLKGIMLARGILGKPWLSASIQNIQNGKKPIRPMPQELYKIIMKHLERTIELYGADGGIKIFRKHLGWYSKGLKNGANFRLGINQIEDEKVLKQKIKNFFLETIID